MYKYSIFLKQPSSDLIFGTMSYIFDFQNEYGSISYYFTILFIILQINFRSVNGIHKYFLEKLQVRISNGIPNFVFNPPANHLVLLQDTQSN